MFNLGPKIYSSLSMIACSDTDTPIMVRSIHRIFDSHVSDGSKEVSSDRAQNPGHLVHDKLGVVTCHEIRIPFFANHDFMVLVTVCDHPSGKASQLRSRRCCPCPAASGIHSCGESHTGKSIRCTSAGDVVKLIPKTTFHEVVIRPWSLTWNLKSAPEKGDSFWKPSFSGSMLNFRDVSCHQALSLAWFRAYACSFSHPTEAMLLRNFGQKLSFS